MWQHVKKINYFTIFGPKYGYFVFFMPKGCWLKGCCYFQFWKQPHVPTSENNGKKAKEKMNIQKHKQVQI
jgi:hypothetical protein